MASRIPPSGPPSLYFSTSPTFFTSVPGSICVPSSDSIEANKVFYVEVETVWKEKENKILLIPAVPAQDITYNDIAACSPLSAIIPTGLLLPLLKHSSNSTPLQGYHSGRRSALVYMDESWFRLKGCGDHVDGITMRDVEDGSGRFSEIRGVQFENTTAREIYMTQLVNRALMHHSMLPANEPLAYWTYDTKWPVQCTCGIFKTYGDRRLNDHLLLGLETLLPQLVDESTADSLRGQFPSDRISDNEVLPTWLAALDDATNLIDLRTAALHVHPPTNLGRLIQDFGYQELLEANIAALEDGLKNNTEALLANLYWRLGWEVGRILHIIHNAQISWGTYPDKLGMHCNAHPNNLILLPPPINNDDESTIIIYTPLLAPLDFDMAFTEKSVTSLTYVDSFRQLLDTEVRSMRLALAGDSELNTGNRGVASLPPSYLPLKWGLRDTLFYD